MRLWAGHAINPAGIRTGIVYVVAETHEDAITRAAMALEAHAWSTSGAGPCRLRTEGRRPA
jgi:hypothetical protein